MRTIIHLIIAAALLVCGCTSPSPPAYPPPDDAIESPLTESSSESLPQALPEAGPEGPLNLEQAIDLALRNNPDVVAAAWDSEAAQARYDYAVGARWPNLSAVGSYAHHLDEQRLLPVSSQGDPTMLSRDIVSGDLVLTLPIFTGGRLVNQIRAAELLQQSAEHRLARSREALVFNVSSVFFSILAQEQVIQSLKFSEQTLQEHLSRVEALIESQKAAKVDRMRTEVRLADVQQRWVLEKNVMAIQGQALAYLLGLADRSAASMIEGDLELDEDALVPEFDAAMATALSNRGDYRAAGSALEAQTRQVEVARAGRSPTVFLQGSYGGRWATGSTQGTAEKLDDIGRIGIGAAIPLFEGGQINAQVREQCATLAAARARLRKLELQIRLDIETALLNIRSSRERIAAIHTAVEQARESLRIERERYDLGKGAIVDVLDAQSALLDSQTNYYRALADMSVAHAQLALATGEQS